MSLLSMLTIDLIRELNEPIEFGKHLWGICLLERELESRQPEPQEEYDSEGNLITGEVMGYVKGVEIWTSPINQ